MLKKILNSGKDGDNSDYKSTDVDSHKDTSDNSKINNKTTFSDDQYDADYEDKKKGLESLLGEMNDLVIHAIIPFQAGGPVDMYLFSKVVGHEGTALATMELLDPAGNGPLPNRLGTYEFVGFTKYIYDNSRTLTKEISDKTPFEKISTRLRYIFTFLADYSIEAVLNPMDTCELPSSIDKDPVEGDESNICVLFDVFPDENTHLLVGERKHHLLLCIEIFPSEMAYARQNGSKELVKKLKKAGYYPYSDLDRNPVV